MGSQFVDFNGDGRIDFFTATYDGTPHVAYGEDGGGFAEPRHVLDKDRERITLGQYWDYDTKTWTGLDADHCTSAVAFDWDADGDFDLLLGDHDHGNLYLRRNDGKPGAPAFRKENEPVLAGGKPFALTGGMGAPRLVDWDADGLNDIVATSFGSAWTGKPPGGVYWYRNVGKEGAPKFAKAVALIPPTETKGHAAERPNVGLYADPVDYDGDGHLDLVVGGYAIWEPKPRKLSSKEHKQLVLLEKERTDLAAKMKRDYDAARKKSEAMEDEEEGNETLREFLRSDVRRKDQDRRSELTGQIDELKPGRKRKAGVWVFLRLGGKVSRR